MTRSRDVANIDGLLTTTGDTYYASAASTPARLGIGTTGQVMTVAAGVPSWATPSGASYTWTSYTPTWTGLTTGNGSLNSCDYLQVGKIMFYRGVFQFGSTTSVTASAFAPSLPAAMSMENRENVGQIRLHDSGTNTFAGFASVWSNALESNVVRLSGSYTDALQLTATVPFTWTTNDLYIWFLTYKVA
jgi:hypothetical protein